MNWNKPTLIYVLCISNNLTHFEQTKFRALEIQDYILNQGATIIFRKDIDLQISDIPLYLFK